MWAFSTFSKLRQEQTVQARVNHHLIWGSQRFPNSHPFPKEKGEEKLKTRLNKNYDTQEREQEVYFGFWLFLKENTNIPSIFFLQVLQPTREKKKCWYYFIVIGMLNNS